jgi:enamine deaminase RidA (YjgF/YER057c/UK114 family)
MATIEHLNPPGLPTNPAFSQAVAVRGEGTTIYVGGQNGVDADGAVAEGIGAQTAQALSNLAAVLEAAGASLERVVRWTVFAVRGAPLADAVASFESAWGSRPNPPAVTIAVVEGLANPDFLIEIDAVGIAE